MYIEEKMRENLIVVITLVLVKNLLTAHPSPGSVALSI